MAMLTVQTRCAVCLQVNLLKSVSYHVIKGSREIDLSLFCFSGGESVPQKHKSFQVYGKRLQQQHCLVVLYRWGEAEH